MTTTSDRVVLLSSKPHKFIYHAYSHLLGWHNACIDHNFGPNSYHINPTYMPFESDSQGNIIDQNCTFSPKNSLFTRGNGKSYWVFEKFFSLFFFIKSFRGTTSPPMLKMHNVLTVGIGVLKKEKNIKKKGNSMYKGKEREIPCKRWTQDHHKYACICAMQL